MTRGEVPNYHKNRPTPKKELVFTPTIGAQGNAITVIADDVTLEAGGYRNPRCPFAARPYEPGDGTVVFQLGKAKH